MGSEVPACLGGLSEQAGGLVKLKGSGKEPEPAFFLALLL